MFKKIWSFNALYIALLVFSAIQTAVSYFVNLPVFIISVIFFVIILAITLFRMITLNSKIKSLIDGINDDLQSATSNALASFNLPIIIVSENDEIIWYNSLFISEVETEAETLIGRSLENFIGTGNVEALANSHKTNFHYSAKFYDIYETTYICNGSTQRILCFVDVTGSKKLASEYRLSRSVSAFIVIDNLDDITRNMRDSERNNVGSRIQNVLEEWFSTVNGISKRFSGERYFFIFEERDLQKFISTKFDVLNKIRSLDFGDKGHATISIGVGHGNNLRECEEQAAQALDMALGRGGDQVAIKRTDNTFQFFGGMTGANEKRSRVRTRIVASALNELIDNSKNVVLMGHKYADSDCFGASYALCSAITKRTGRQAHIGINSKTSLIKPLLSRISELKGDVPIMDAVTLMQTVDSETLLIILDTHRPALVECPELLDIAGTVVVIDHHRKAVDFISNAVIFYHETSASSTCEMVSELLEYIDESSVGRAEAEAMLSGIMLDTKNYCLNTGVRTFEASAFLRRRGADPIAVKKLFSDSMDEYKNKNAIIASSKQYKQYAIAVNNTEKETAESLRIVSSQSADELLNIFGIKASFVMFKTDDILNISARSYGDVNVQLIMEFLGGGGHRTMAACQLKNCDFDTAYKMIIEAIDNYEKG